ncbi:MAG TPA: dockerin type I domain-containing protein [Candidatus Paceibacterota bacterium]|nr:dockerin type I domain-containing protein [Candidatus Paceibacterota bacterium]
MRTKRALVLALAALFAAPHAFAQDATSSSYQILTPTLGASGAYATSTNYSLLGTIGEFANSTATSSSFGLNLGFVAFPWVTTPVIAATGATNAASLSWTAAVGALGYSTASYSIGQSTTSGGPYSFSSVGNVLSATASSLTANQTYYFIVRAHDSYGLTIATSSEVSAVPTAAAAPPPTQSGSLGGGGIGGGFFSPVVTGTASANFSGRAYPRSTVTLLKDAQVVSSVAADANAMFSISLSNLSAGNFIFSVYGEDGSGNRSGMLSFPVSLTAGATTNITGIFISPTISTDKEQVKRGDNLVIFGQSAPQSSVTITVNSDTELFLQSKSDSIGAYLYTLDTAPLELGSHSAKSKAAVAGEISEFGQAVDFAVGTESITRQATKKCGIGDLNCDGKVNLIDYSIMAYWYHRPLSGRGVRADLNKDVKVNLTDFSILAAHWTG